MMKAIKVATIGSCLSNVTIAHLCTAYGWHQTHSVHHNRSDAFLNYFIEKLWRPIPLNLLSELLVPKIEFRETAEKFLFNQYESYLGFHDLLQNKKNEDSNFVTDMNCEQIDVLLLDNLIDLASVLAYPTDMPDYEGSGLFLNFGFYENAEGLKSKFTYGDYLSPESSVSNWIKIVRWIKLKQPKARIFFLLYHSFTSKFNVERLERIDNFNCKARQSILSELVDFVLPLSPPIELTMGYEDWPHFAPPIYQALAGTIYLRYFNALPEELSTSPRQLHSMQSNQEIDNSRNPYADLPDTSYWRRSVSNRRRDRIDPVLAPRFKIAKPDKIATAGSCFAQNISANLVQESYNYIITERSPSSVGATDENYGVFPARFGNIYNTRQLVELFDRAFEGEFPTEAIWQRADGKFIDGFRPQIQREGFATAEEAIADREVHLNAVRDMFKEMTVFIFTLGLTETWFSEDSGFTVPFAPGAVRATAGHGVFKFRNSTVRDTVDDLERLFRRIKLVNAGVGVILTVSPVPLIATYEPRHVVESTAFSKAVLRVAAGELERSWQNVQYFPSFEVFTGTSAAPPYFEPDLREPTAEGVKYVMRLFRKHYLVDEGSATSGSPSVTQSIRDISDYERNVSQIICDENILDTKFSNWEN